MTETFKPAEKLTEVAAQAILEPLQVDDPRYVSLASGRGTKELKQLQLHLEDQSGRQNRFAKVAFTGHRGSGKSTELLRLEQRLSNRFTCIHLAVDETLSRDLDYTDLLLWLVESVAKEFAKLNMPLNKRLVDDVTDWFAETAVEDIDSLKAGITTETGIEGEGGLSLYVVSLKILARLKSQISGNIERRRTIRQHLQNYSTDLIRKVNLLLDNAARVLEENGKIPDLLIVHDNLDRLSAAAARRLFLDNGELLKDLRAHFVFTAPIALIMSPANIGTVFDQNFMMPMVKTQSMNGRSHRVGIKAMFDLVAARINIEMVFSSTKVVHYLAQMSGGSVRDLMRLINFAQLDARVDDKLKIDMASAKEAVGELRKDFVRLLVPGQFYFPLLADVHLSKELTIRVKPDKDSVQEARAFCAELMLMGALLEYSGEECWYDVHPVIRDIEAFADAIEQSQEK